MDVKQNLYEMQQQLVDVFKAQDPDTGYFDVIFDMDDKKLYAHRFRLSGISPTFNSMLSDRSNLNKNEPIKIKDYKIEYFKEFLMFIYSGECNLSDKIFFTMVDMAEFYCVRVFKACKQYLSKMEINSKNFLMLLDIADKYSIVYKAAEIRVTEKLKKESSLSMTKELQKKLSDNLPAFNFTEMNTEVVSNYVVTKSFLFASEEFKKIHFAAYSKAYVKITDKNGKKARGILNCSNMNKVVEVIQSLKNVSSRYNYWTTGAKKLLRPSLLIKKDEIDWYLVFDYDGDLALMHQRKIREWDYLLAEMFAENGFTFDYDCKIEVNRYT